MPDKDTLRKAIDLTLQVFSYSQIGPAAADLAAGVRSDLDSLTRDLPEAVRNRLTLIAIAADRERHTLDRARNHFIKDFRARFGADARGYPVDVRAQLDAGMADFTKRKSLVVEDAASQFFSELQLEEHPA